MAIELKKLGLLSLDDQESLLEGMMAEYHPIEVNNKKFMIPSQVNELIDDLFIELNDLKIKLEEKDIGESKN